MGQFAARLRAIRNGFLTSAAVPFVVSCDCGDDEGVGRSWSGMHDVAVALSDDVRRWWSLVGGSFGSTKKGHDSSNDARGGKKK